MSKKNREIFKAALMAAGLTGFYVEEDGEMTLEGDLWRKTLQALGENPQILFFDPRRDGRTVEIPLMGVTINGATIWIGVDHYEAGPFVRPDIDGWMHPWYRP